MLTPHPATPKDVVECVAEVVGHFDWSGPVGVTFPGVVTSGVTRTAANVDKGWVDTDARGLIGDRLGLPVTVLNDADAAGIAEMTFGAGRGRKGTVIVLTLGTGIGSALFVDGRLRPQHRAGPPGAERPRRGEARLHQGQGGRGPELAPLGAPGAEVPGPCGDAVLARTLHHRRRGQPQGRQVPAPDRARTGRDGAGGAAEQHAASWARRWQPRAARCFCPADQDRTGPDPPEPEPAPAPAPTAAGGAVPAGGAASVRRAGRGGAADASAGPSVRSR